MRSWQPWDSATISNCYQSSSSIPSHRTSHASQRKELRQRGLGLLVRTFSTTFKAGPAPAATRRSPRHRPHPVAQPPTVSPGGTAVVPDRAEDARTPANTPAGTLTEHTAIAHALERGGTEEGSRVGGDHSRGAGVLWLDPDSGHRGRSGPTPSDKLRTAAPSGGTRRPSPTSAAQPARTWHHHQPRHAAPWLGQA
jgi:hypothetical protein